jgi:hypothetical protein
MKTLTTRITKYTPAVGDSVAAKRLIKSDFLPNLIVGPVVSVLGDFCRIVCNPETYFETHFVLRFEDWSFQNLYPKAENED